MGSRQQPSWWARRIAAPLAALCLSAGACAAVAAAVAAAGNGPQSSLPCPPHGQVLLARDRVLAVYRPHLGATLRPGEPRAAACLAAGRTRMTLIPAAPPHAGLPGAASIRRIALARAIVAFVADGLTGVDTSASELVVADVARRAIVRRAPAGHTVDAGLIASEATTALAAAPSGAVAWIVRRSGPALSKDPAVTVYVAARSGPAHVLDEGAGIDPGTLSITGSTVNWKDGGVARTAALP